MVYETGVASSPLDLLNKLVTFITANGWTAQDPTTANAKVISKGTVFAGVLAGADHWGTRGCLSFSGAAAYDAQPNAASATHFMTMGAGPYTAYHFYLGDEVGSDYINVVIEKIAGEYRHWTLGELIKYGSYTGGTISDSTHLSDTAFDRNNVNAAGHRYICDAACTITTNQDSHVYIDYDTKVDNWELLGDVADVGTSRMLGSMRNAGILAAFMAIGYQRFNLRTPLWPLEYFVNRGDGLRSPIGRLAHMRAVNLLNFVPGEIITVGSDQWQLFPVFQRQTAAVASTIVSSGLLGYAYRR